MRTSSARTFLALMIPALGLSSPSPGSASGEDRSPNVSRSVVKVVSTQRRPSISAPWSSLPQEEVSGSGVVIGGRILTNAQVVKYSSRVVVESSDPFEKRTAIVEHLAEDLDLALLKLEDPGRFFEDHPPLPRLAALPRAKDEVFAYGYPLGGDTLSITRGIVSRIEFEQYYYDTFGLRIQVDAAINSGNSGGPALVDQRMIGIIFNRLEESDNIGYIIPNEEIDLFLGDVADGTYDGKPQLFDSIKQVENRAQRDALKLPERVHGLACIRPSSLTPSPVLRPMDVISAIGDRPIDAAGKVDAGDGLRLDCQYLVQKLARDGKVPVTVYRDGSPIDLALPVPTGRRRKQVMPQLMGRDPSYFIWGPLAFGIATEDYLDDIESGEAAGRWLAYLSRNHNAMLARQGDFPRFEGEQLVMAMALFPHPVSRGYLDPKSQIVDTVDGVKVRNLRHLAELLRSARGERVTIGMSDRYSETLIFNRREVEAASEEILAENGIRSPCSDDLKDLLKPDENQLRGNRPAHPER